MRNAFYWRKMTIFINIAPRLISFTKIDKWSILVKENDHFHQHRLISFTKIDKWSILVKEMRGDFLAAIFWRRFFRRHGQKKSAGPGPPIGPTMPWPGNFSDTLTPHLRTPIRIWLHNPRLISFGKKTTNRDHFILCVDTIIAPMPNRDHFRTGTQLT